MHIGYVITQRGVAIPWLGGHPYRGIDRLLPFPNPLDLGDDVLGRTWSGYWDAWDSGELGKDRQKAEEFAGRLRELGMDIEVIYAAVAAQPRRIAQLSEQETATRSSRMQWQAERYAGVPPPPPDFVALGLDVSPAAPSFHSVIFQPGPGFAHDSAFASHLNEFGLIGENDFQYASDLMDAANTDGYLLSRFHVIRILVQRAT
jgi:hypothetical protein